MPEPTLPTIEQLTAEIATLRSTNSDLLAKKTTHKAKIAELEAANVDFQSKLTAANNTIHQVTIEGPLKQMAESLSPHASELFLEQFNKSYRLEMIEGKLTVVSANDGKPAGVPFERAALAQHLTTGDDATAKAFRAITVVSLASGGNMQRTAPVAAPKPVFQFGLR